VGTSTGSIAAAALALNHEAREVIALYQKHARAIFTPLLPWNQVFHKYSSATLRSILFDFFHDPDTKHPLRWRDLHTRASVELIVTLWNVSEGKTCYLSTNPHRRGQDDTLSDAFVADIITACCSAPYFFPPRAFRVAKGDIVYCDGGITGLNNPAVYATALLIDELRRSNPDVPLQVLSFGSGKCTDKTDIDDINTWTLMDAARNTIEALMSSSAVLMDDFYRTLGGHLGLTCVRTNHPRERTEQLDDVAGIPKLLRNYSDGKIHYQLFSAASNSDERPLTPETLATVCQNALELAGKVAAFEPIVIEPIPRKTPYLVLLTVFHVIWRLSRSVLRIMSAVPSSCLRLAGRLRRRRTPPGKISWEVRASWLTNPDLTTRVGLLCISLFTLVAAVVVFYYLRAAAVTAHSEAQAANARQLQDAGVTQARFGDMGLSVLLTAEGLKLVRPEDTAEVEAARRAITLMRARLAPLRYIHQFEGRKEGKDRTVVGDGEDGKKRKVGIRAGAVDQKRSIALMATTDAAVLFFDVGCSKPGPVLDSRGNPIRIQLDGELDQTSITSVAIRPDGNQFALATIGGWIHLFDMEKRKEAMKLKHPGRAMSVAYSPDCKKLVVAGRDSRYLAMYDLTDGSSLEFPVQEDLYAAAYSPDGRWLACCGELEPTPRVTLFRADDPGVKPIALIHAARVFTLRFSPDNQSLVTGGIDGSVRFWKLAQESDDWFEDGSPIHHPKQVRMLAFDSDGQRLLVGGEDATARLWDSALRRPIAQTLYHLDQVRVGDIAEAGRMVTGDDNGNVRIWDIPKPDPYTLVLPHPAPVWDVDFGSAGAKLVTGCLNALRQPGSARVWELDLTGWTVSPPIELVHGSDVYIARFRPNDPNTVATAGNNKLVRLWDVQKQSLRMDIKPHHSFILTGGFSPDGRYFAFAGAAKAGNEFRVLDLGSQEVTSAKETGGKVLAFIWNVGFSRTGRLLTDGGNEARLWEIKDGQLGLMRELKYTDSDTFAMASEDGRWVLVFGRVTGNEPSRAILWDLARPSTEPIALGGSVGTHSGRLTVAAFHPTKPVLATASTDGTVRLWGTDGSRAIAQDLEHESAVDTVVFSPDGRYLATGTREGFLHVWSTDTGKRTGATWLHGAPVNKVIFSPNGELIATASRDGTARVCRLPQPTNEPMEDLVRELECETGITVGPTIDQPSSGTSNLRRLAGRPWAASFTPPHPLRADEWNTRREALERNKGH
jgi:WD40 repeat protein